VLASASLTTAENSGAAAWPQYLPCVDCDGVRWAVSYTEVFNGTSGDQDIRTSLVARNGFNLVVHEVRIATAFSASSEFDATCASTYSGSGIPSQAPPAYGIANSRVLAAGGSALDTDLYLGHGGSAGYTVRPTGCGSLDMLSSGLPILGQQFGFLTVQSYPIQAYAFGTPLSVPLPMPGCNGCTAGVDGTLVVGATLSITVPTDASLFGVAFSVQGLAVGGGTCLGNLSLSATYDFLVQ